MYERFIKRILDFLLSFILIIIFLPVILIISILLLFFNSGNVLFFQDRPGLNGHIFKVIKFKSMNDKLSNSGDLLPDEQRLTKLGSFIRSSSIDELPQLFNVLAGDMSFIGPRPLLTKYLPLYTKEQNRRHLVRPGITGLAQINGRNNISWEKKFELDVSYVDNISLKQDLLIFFATIKTVFLKKGIKKNGHATTDTFTGCS